MLKASTLVETITASLIVALSFGVGTMIYFNILSSSSTINEEVAYAKALTVVHETIINEKYENDQWQKDGWTFKQEISDYQAPDLYLINIIVFQGGVAKFELKRIVKMDVE